MAFWRKKNDFNDEDWDIDEDDWFALDDDHHRDNSSLVKVLLGVIVFILLLCGVGWVLRGLFTDSVQTEAIIEPGELSVSTTGSSNMGVLAPQVSTAVSPTVTLSQATATLPPTRIQQNITPNIYDPDVLAVWMLDMINTDRLSSGLSPVALDETAAFAATLHSKDMLQNSYFSHWNLDGFGPEHRYAQVGGEHTVRENLHAFSYTYNDGSGAPIDNWQEVIENAQIGLMNSPGHRDNILDPAHTHVGIGMAYEPATGEFRLAQEFTNQYVALNQTIPEQAELGDEIVVNGRIANGNITNILLDLAYEPFPSPMSRDELNQTSTYTPRAQSMSTTRINAEFDETVTIDASGDPGLYHIRIFGDLATDQALLLDRIITVEAGDDVVSSITPDYLFEDDFEKGISTQWLAIDGEWTMINGNLQATSGDVPIISIGDDSWEDYTVEVSFGGLENTVASGKRFIENNPNALFIGVRQDENAANGMWFNIINVKQTCTKEENNEQTIQFSEEEERLNSDSHIARLEVSDNLYQFYLNGTLKCSFTDSTFSGGRVTVAMYPGTGANPAYPWVESIRIYE